MCLKEKFLYKGAKSRLSSLYTFAVAPLAGSVG